MNTNVNLEWYCVNWNSNMNKPYAINIMKCINLKELEKKLNYKGKASNEYNSIKSWYELRNFLKREFMHHYWSKCEYEIVVSDNANPKYENGVKIDVWSQIAPNLNEITNYLIRKTNIRKIKEIDNPEQDKDLHFGLNKYM